MVEVGQDRRPASGHADLLHLQLFDIKTAQQLFLHHCHTRSSYDGDHHHHHHHRSHHTSPAQPIPLHPKPSGKTAETRSTAKPLHALHHLRLRPRHHRREEQQNARTGAHSLPRCQHRYSGHATYPRHGFLRERAGGFFFVPIYATGWLKENWRVIRQGAGGSNSIANGVRMTENQLCEKPIPHARETHGDFPRGTAGGEGCGGEVYDSHRRRGRIVFITCSSGRAASSTGPAAAEVS